MEKWRPGSATRVPNFVEIDAQERKLCAIFDLVRRRRRKIRRKFAGFHGFISQERLGRFLSNLVCKVLYMVALKYVEMVEIGAIGFEL